VLRARPRPPRFVEAMRRGRQAAPQSEETRARTSAALRRPGTRPPKAGRLWTPEADELVRTLPAAEAARRTGRTLKAVWARRRELGMPDGRTRAARAAKASGAWA